MKQAKNSSTLATTITSFLFTLKGQASPRKLWQDLANKRRVRSRISDEMDRVLHSVFDHVMECSYGKNPNCTLGVGVTWTLKKDGLFLTNYRFGPFTYCPRTIITHS
jgi:hypothetical protein